MDYEVFLIGRIREYWDRGESNEDAVASGLAHTARPITTAAAIMVAVFVLSLHMCWSTNKLIRARLAVAIDALIVRPYSACIDANVRAVELVAAEDGTKTNRASNNSEISCDSTTNGTSLDLLAHSSSER
jgi:hypothetical protein